MSEYQYLHENRAILLTAINSRKGTNASVDERIQASLSAVTDWGYVLKYLIHHGTLISFSNHVSRLQLNEYVPDEVAESLRRTELILRYRNARYTEEMKKVARLFNTAEVPLVFLKGAMLLISGYYDGESRFMNDLDAIIRDQDVTKAGELLANLHYSEFAGGNQQSRYQYKGELAFVSRDDREITLELSTRLNKNVELRRCYPFRDDELPGKLSRKLVDGIAFSEVEKEFHFVYCLFHHVALNYLHRLNWLDDLHLMVSDPDLDFDKVARYLEKYRLTESWHLLQSIFSRHFHMNFPLAASRIPVSLQELYLADSCRFINLEELEPSNVSIRFSLIEGAWNKMLVVLNKIILPAGWLREYYGLRPDTSCFVVYLVHLVNSLKRLLKVR